MKHRALLLLAICLVSIVPAGAREQERGASLLVSGLHERVRVTRDKFGIAHIEAANHHDLYFMQGYVHAMDRLFQMDVARRQASGTLAELLGVEALAGDVELRTIGVRRAAERSLAVISVEARAALEAYADGVNAFIAGSPTLPPEYQAIEITGVAPWTALDSMTITKAIAFSLAFNLEDIDNSVALLTYSAVLGPGTGLALFSEDLFRAEPFTHASTVPDASTAASGGGNKGKDKKGKEWKGAIDPEAVGLVKAYGDRVRGLPFFKDRMNRDRRPGSNEWAVSGRHTASGSPLIANDPHLPLGMPSTFYPIRLTSGASDATGSGFAGVPFVWVGQTRDIAWGATACPMDITDVFQEQIAPDPTSPSGLSTIFRGQPEHVVAIPETYRINVIGDGVRDNLVPLPPGSTPPATLIVPRRNNGPIVQLDLAAGTALSVQHTGFSGTRELDSFLI